MIQSARELAPSKAGNPRFEVYFTDGTHAQTKSDAECNNNLLTAENVAPNSIEVTYERGKIAAIKTLGMLFAEIEDEETAEESQV